MTKKTLSLLLCALMLVGILPMSAFALSVDDIVRVNITDVEVPVAGEEPDYTCAEDTTAGAMPYYTYEDDDDMVKTVFGKTWFDKTENERPLKVGETFVAGHVYILAVSVITKGDYKFITEAVPEEGTYSRITATVNGESAKVVVPSGYDPKKHAVIRYEFAPCAKRQIEQVYFSDIVAPRIGQKPVYVSAMDSLAHGGGYTTYEQFDDMETIVYGKRWIDLDNDAAAIGKDDVFEAGHRYAIDIYVCPTSEGEFSSLSAIDAKVNGRFAQVFAVEGYDYNEVVCLRYEFAECRGDAVSNINASIAVPAAGQNPSYDVTCDANNCGTGDFRNPVYSKNGVMWFRDENNSVMAVGGADTVFEAGKSYTAKIVFTPDDGYGFAEDLVVMLNGEAAEFERLDDTNVVLSRSFTVASDNGNDGPEVYENPFTDVAEGKWYYNSVIWAVASGITSGTTDTTFSPKMICTRAQAVQFLWTAAGKPEPTTTENPFTDVAEGKWYYKAVMWAVENGITAGTTPTTFSPNTKCDRSQIVTFIQKWVQQGALEIAGQPQTYQMTSSQEDAAYTVTVRGEGYPYTYTWHVLMDNDEYVEIHKNAAISNTFSYEFTDYDFENYRAISVWCEIEDCYGDTVQTNFVTVISKDGSVMAAPLSIVTQPKPYQMTSSQEEAAFAVSVTGGNAPYTYVWYVEMDDTAHVTDYTTSATADTFTYEFTDYDFEEYRSIVVYCDIIDATGQTVTSNVVSPIQHGTTAPLSIVTQPKNYQMTSSQEDAAFAVSISGGQAPYSYRWYVEKDNDQYNELHTTTAVADTFIYEFSDYDFEDYRDITVYCIIKDASGQTVQTNYVYPLQK